jgi:hypothetical protein
MAVSLSVCWSLHPSVRACIGPSVCSFCPSVRPPSVRPFLARQWCWHGAAKQTNAASTLVELRLHGGADAWLRVGAGSSAEAAGVLLGPSGVGADDAGSRAAGCSAVGLAMAEGPAAMFPPLLGTLRTLLDRTEAEALSEEELHVRRDADRLACS